jgi:ketosteroid isomerase-like protein
LSDQADIVELERRFAHAILHKDIPALEALLAHDYRLVGVRSTGSSDMPRQAWFVALHGMTFRALDLATTSVEVHGDMALATVEGAWALDYDGRAIDERVYVTDVWIRRDGRWQIVRRHSSPYPRSS